MNLLHTLALVTTMIVASSLATAQHQGHGPSGSGPHNEAASIAVETPMSEGEIRKVNKDSKKITIRHGELKNLEMPPMTMIFQVKDPAMLDQVKAGDKIRFVAEKIGGKFTVMALEVQN